MLKELKTLLQKYFGISSPKPTATKKPTPVRAVAPHEKINSLVSEIGKHFHQSTFPLVFANPLKQRGGGLHMPKFLRALRARMRP